MTLNKKTNTLIIYFLFIVMLSLNGACAELTLDQALRDYTNFIKDFNQPNLSSTQIKALDVKNQQLIQAFQTCENDAGNKIKELAKISEISVLNTAQNSVEIQNDTNVKSITSKIENAKKELIECRLKLTTLEEARLKLLELKKTLWIDGIKVRYDVWSFLHKESYGIKKVHVNEIIPVSINALILIFSALSIYFFMWFKGNQFNLNESPNKPKIDYLKTSLLVLLNTHLIPLLLALIFWYIIDSPHKITLLLIIVGLMIRDLCILMPIKMSAANINKNAFKKFIVFSTTMIITSGYFWKVINYRNSYPKDWLLHNSPLISPLFLLVTVLFIFNCLYFYKLLKPSNERYLPLTLLVFSIIIPVLYLGSYVLAAQYLMVMSLSLFMVHLILKIINALRKILLCIRLTQLKLIEKQQGKEPATYSFPFWVSLITSVVSGFLSLAFLSWVGGLSSEAYRQISFLYSKGFYVGSIKVIPSNLFVATIVVIILIVLLTRLRYGIEYKWFKNSRLRKESREVGAILIWYIGITIISLTGLSIAGFDVSNLAIIAGALSVGIGFGLQNIVSNFVSGLILLFERPVKSGDWVEVGSTVGFIEKIKIRATRIKTFDNAEILVPNSELLSNHVKNWTLSNSIGRVTIKVGVAYGTDTQKVKKILLQVAKDHKQVINHSPYESNVVFREFGDSSLNFELRVMIKDIKNIIQVLSDLNFEVDRIFRESDISIPFPQRDLHIVDTVPINVNNDKINLNESSTGVTTVNGMNDNKENP
jgi:small-conductance mechanosensitive channel